MTNKKQNFINTSDEDTAKTLRKLGFQELPKNGKYYIFINDNKLAFSLDDMKDVSYSNILTF